MQDITQYSDNELSLIIFNDEYLYTIRHGLTKEGLTELGIIFTNEQWEEFKSDLENEEEWVMSKERIIITAKMIDGSTKDVAYKDAEYDSILSMDALERTKTSIKNGWIKKTLDGEFINCAHIVSFKVKE